MLTVETMNCKFIVGTKNLRVEKGNLVIEAHNDNPNVWKHIRLYLPLEYGQRSRGLEILPGRGKGKTSNWKVLASHLDVSDG